MSEMSCLPAAVEGIMDAIEEDNKKRGFSRRISLKRALKTSGPRLVTVYRHSTSTPYGLSLRGAKDISATGEFRGQYIRSVDLDSPADQAGLKAGDRILAVNGEPCEAAAHGEVKELIANSGTTLRLLVVQDPELGNHARAVTRELVKKRSDKVVDKVSGNLMLTAEMKEQRLGRTRKLQQTFHPTSPTQSEMSFVLTDEKVPSASAHVLGTLTEEDEDTAASGNNNRAGSKQLQGDCLVHKDFVAKRDDELSVQSGDVVTVTAIYKDTETGDTLCMAETTDTDDDHRSHGLVPASHLTKFGFDMSF